MKRSTLPLIAPRLHVAIVMDGNGRWATARGLPRSAGHREGARAVRRVVEAATVHGIGTLTLFAFSGDNWRRPPGEVATLMSIFRQYLRRETARCLRNGIRLSVIGRRDRIPPALCATIETAEAATASGRRMHLKIAVDYSARDAILEAAGRLAPCDLVSRESFARALGEVMHAGGPSSDVDLLIRTGGEQRLSDSLLWESAYAELLFTQRMWPDFGAADLKAALEDYRHRERRFGALPHTAAS